MTKEEKQLLLKDLCARLPYDIIVRVHDIKYGDFDSYIDSISNNCVETYPVEELTIDFNPCVFYKLQDIKSYLRSMSSMTEEEKEELKQEHIKDEKLYAECLTKAANGDDSMRGKVIPHFAADWCNKNHFDYRGLIPMGLALEAPEGMYK